jgi:hypothetical protein
MKLGERISFDDKLLHIQQRHDVSATLKRAEMMRHAHEQGHHGQIPKDWVPVGVVPAVMQRVWAQEAGVRMDDPEAMQELLKKKLMNGEFGKFRITGGNI